MATILKDLKSLGKFHLITTEQKQETMPIMRGDIFMVDLSPVKGKEQGGYRPVLVVSNNVGNRYSSIITVIPISSMIHEIKRPNKKKMPTHVFLDKKSTELEYDSEVLCEHFRTLDKERLKNYQCSLSSELMKEVDHAMEISLGLSDY